MKIKTIGKWLNVNMLMKTNVVEMLVLLQRFRFYVSITDMPY